MNRGRARCGANVGSQWNGTVALHGRSSAYLLAGNDGNQQQVMEANVVVMEGRRGRTAAEIAAVSRVIVASESSGGSGG